MEESIGVYMQLIKHRTTGVAQAPSEPQKQVFRGHVSVVQRRSLFAGSLQRAAHVVGKVVRGHFSLALRSPPLPIALIELGIMPTSRGRPAHIPQHNACTIGCELRRIIPQDPPPAPLLDCTARSNKTRFLHALAPFPAPPYSFGVSNSRNAG